jgi:small redox-active disulfide protein 2
MVSIKVLGSGCANCRKLEALTLDVVRELGLQAQVEHVTDPKDIFAYPLLSTPGLVINEKLVSAGRIPRKEEIAGWLNGAEN